jgi:hypothetical protein
VLGLCPKNERPLIRYILENRIPCPQAFLAPSVNAVPAYGTVFTRILLKSEVRTRVLSVESDKHKTVPVQYVRYWYRVLSDLEII